MWLDDQLELLAPLFERAGEPFHVVWHSYGGAIALKAALKYGERVRSLVLYEPVLFALLMRAAPETDAAREIRALREDTTNLPPAAAAQRFIDYWMGEGTWTAMPEARRFGLVNAVRAVTPEWHSAFHRHRLHRRGAGRRAPRCRSAPARAGGRACRRRAHGAGARVRARQSAHRAVPLTGVIRW